MSRVTELEAELQRANSRIAELEKYAKERPLTIRQMKAEIAQVIGVEFSRPYSYGMATISRDDMFKIYMWIMARAKK